MMGGVAEGARGADGQISVETALRLEGGKWKFRVDDRSGVTPGGAGRGRLTLGVADSVVLHLLRGLLVLEELAVVLPRLGELSPERARVELRGGVSGANLQRGSPDGDAAGGRAAAGEGRARVGGAGGSQRMSHDAS